MAQRAYISVKLYICTPIHFRELCARDNVVPSAIPYTIVIIADTVVEADVMLYNIPVYCLQLIHNDALK